MFASVVVMDVGSSDPKRSGSGALGESSWHVEGSCNWFGLFSRIFFLALRSLRYFLCAMRA